MNTNKPRSTSQGDTLHLWDECPTDVLLNIFHYLPMSALAVCMFVNTTWRSHVEYFIEVKNRWKDFVNATTIYSGQLKPKAFKCDWKQIFYNYILWHIVDKASIKLQQVTKINNIKLLRIYRGKLNVIVPNSVLCYDPMTLTNQRTVGLMLCRDFYENDSMIIVVTEYEKWLKLHVFKKITADDMFDLDEHYLRTVEHVLCYKFHDNHCYYLDKQNALYICTVFEGQLRIFFNARCYGNPGPKLTQYINILNNQMYVLYKDGSILWVDPVRRNFRRLAYSKDLFKKSGSGAGALNQKTFHWYCQRDGESYPFSSYNTVTHVELYKKQLHIESYSRFNSYNDSTVIVHVVMNASCMLQHGDILFVGYTDGTLDIISLRDCPLDKDPLRSFNLKDLQEDLIDLQIICIEVYEEDAKQYLFIATSTQLFRVCITYENCEKFLWSDEVCVKCILPRLDYCQALNCR